MSHSQKRNTQIEAIILKVLNPESKTLSCLYRDLNSGLPATALRGGARGRTLFGKIKMDKRTLNRHLNYLVREKRLYFVKQEKVLIRDNKSVSWQVKYYFRPEFGFSKLLESLFPHLSLKRTYIHNPFIGNSGLERYIDWLAKPQ